MTQLLLTPGPLTTHARVREAMDRDWGSRDPAFIALTAELRRRLLDVVKGASTHVAVPIQGAGTYVLEAAVATLVAQTDKLLVLVNGAYGLRMAEIARRLGRSFVTIEEVEDTPISAERVRAALAADPAITHVSLVHVETTTGLLNPLHAIATVVSQAGRTLLLDAMASFGAVPIDLTRTPVGAVLASSNKCLEGAPGVAFALVDQSALARARGVSPSLSLDIEAQAKGFEQDGQWRFTPPVQVVAALVEALRQLEAEGGPAARLARYAANLDVLVAGLRVQGFKLLLRPELQSPIIATFRQPTGFDFKAFYAALGARGFIIYPGKVTRVETFRIGCIGQVFPVDMARLVEAIAEIGADSWSLPACSA